MTPRLRITLLALVCALIAVLSTATAAAHIAPLDTPPTGELAPVTDRLQQFDSAYRLTARYDRANRAVSSTDLPVKDSTDGRFDDHVIAYHTDTASPVITGTQSNSPAFFESSSTHYNFELDATDQSGFGNGIELPSSHVFTRDTGGRVTNATNRFYLGTVTSNVVACCGAAGGTAAIAALTWADRSAPVREPFLTSCPVTELFLMSLPVTFPAA